MAADTGSAFAQAWKQLLPSVLRRAEKLARNHEDAQDLAQTAWQRAWMAYAAGELRDPRGELDTPALRRFVFTTVRTAFLDLRRRQRVRAAASLDAPGPKGGRLRDHVPCDRPHPEQLLFGLDRGQLAVEALARLLQRQPILARAVIEHDLLGQHYAAIPDASPAVLRKRRERAVLALRADVAERERREEGRLLAP